MIESSSLLLIASSNLSNRRWQMQRSATISIVQQQQSATAIAAIVNRQLLQLAAICNSSSDNSSNIQQQRWQQHNWHRSSATGRCDTIFGYFFTNCVLYTQYATHIYSNKNTAKAAKPNKQSERHNNQLGGDGGWATTLTGYGNRSNGQ